MKNFLQFSTIFYNFLQFSTISFIFSVSAVFLCAQDDATLIDVTSLDQLDAMRHDLDGDGRPISDHEAAWEAAFGLSVMADDDDTEHNGSDTVGYELTADLDFNGTKWENPTGGTFSGTRVTGGWNPIGITYLGTFDGNGHTISNIFIDRDVSLVGLFGHIGAGSEVRNLGIEGGSVKGQHTGPLAGIVSGTVRVCYATANAEGTHTNDFYVGGLVGRLSGGTMASCYATGIVSSTSGSSRCGGLVGGVANSLVSPLGVISNCYATGNVTAEGTGARSGGLIGDASSSSITACYATGDATGATARGGVGTATSTMITASYFDYEVSNRPSTDEGAWSTTVLQSTLDYTFIFEAWDTQEQWGGGSQYVWDLCSGDQYPKLSVDFDGDGTPSVGEFGAQGPCTSSFARIIDLETAGTAQDTKITELETGQTTHGTKLTELEAAGTAQDTKITELETGQTEHGTKLTELETGQSDLETSQTAQDTKLTELETAGAAQDTKITELETAGAAQDTKITALETAKTELEMGQTTHGTKLTELETAQAALQAKIAAFEAALTNAGVDIPDPPTGGTPGGGGGNPGGGTTPPTGGTPGTTPPSTTTIYSVPATSGTPQAYPNPAQHTLLFANLTPGSRYVYKIYTAGGNFLTSGTVQDDKAINISTLESGQYLLTLQNNDREVLRTSLLIE